jgi:hypothetical protein
MAGAALPETPLPDWNRDFDGRPRAPGAIGAYGDIDARPAWPPRLERKPDPSLQR